VTTRLTPNRSEALQIGYAATDWSRPIDFDAYAAAVADWDVKAIERDGQCIGAAFFKDDEVHASVVPEWRKRWATKGVLKELFAKDRVTTRVTPGHEYMNDILKRLGFTEQPDGMFVKEAHHGH
jgi:hypothetical protein